MAPLPVAELPGGYGRGRGWLLPARNGCPAENPLSTRNPDGRTTDRSSVITLMIAPHSA